MRNKKTALERFEEKYIPEPNTGCWLWCAGSGGTSTRGINRYGVFSGGYAHRWSYEYFKGPIPKGMTVDHKCRQTFCVNPEHLRLQTVAENVRGSVSFNGRKSVCKYGHPLTPENIYHKHQNQGHQRECRICKRAMRKVAYKRYGIRD